MNSNDREVFEKAYQAGKEAFERGQYRESIECLEVASQQVRRSSRLGGEVQMWLVTAYQATSDLEKAVELCEGLMTHPYSQISKQAKDLLYIIKAPALKRPQEWMSEIPNLKDLSEASEKKYVRAKTTATKPREKGLNLEPVDLTQVNREDNGFIGLGLMIILVMLGLWWLMG